jgi:hypothetical protein
MDVFAWSLLMGQRQGCQLLIVPVNRKSAVNTVALHLYMQGLTTLSLLRQAEIIWVVQTDMYQVFTRERMFYFHKLSEDILCVFCMDAKVDTMYGNHAQTVLVARYTLSQ